jgi:hypothetical protein
VDVKDIRRAAKQTTEWIRINIVNGS